MKPNQPEKLNKPKRLNRRERPNRPDRPEKGSNEVVETIRFINLPNKRRVESVRRHREWQKLLDKDRFFKEVFGENVRNRTNQRDQIIADTK